MELALAETLANAIEDSKLVEGYSGRGMYGRTTTGIIVKSPTAALECVIKSPQLFLDDKHQPLHGFKGVDGFRFDNMGKDFILY
jgi:hypothetical protein